MGLQLSIRAVCVAAILAAAGCGGTSPAPDPPPPLERAPFSLWLSASRVSDKEPSELVAVLVNHNGPAATFGVAARLDRWDGRSWVPHRVVETCLAFWFCTGGLHPAGDEIVIRTIGLQPPAGGVGPSERFSTKGLDKGWYRISQKANEGVVATAILQVVPGADPIAPLDPVDKPAIMIAPVLVKPSGATVLLLPPLVPGVRSSGEREPAVAGLAETAALERWDGHGWQPMTDVALKPSPTEPLSHNAELPALAEGDYRLVRAGPNGAHTGRFWVTGAVV